jgi:hypothetical protein
VRRSGDCETVETLGLAGNRALVRAYSHPGCFGVHSAVCESVKKWIPVLAGFGAGFALALCLLCLTPRPTEDTFIEAPVNWASVLLERSIPTLGLGEIVAFLVIWFLYWSCLGALLGLLLQSALRMFHRLQAKDG